MDYGNGLYIDDKRLAMFTYCISQEVRIKPLGLDGMVMQRCDRGAGQHDYQVVYWADSKRQVEWLLPHELEAKP